MSATYCPKCRRRVMVDDHARGAKERDGARVDPRPIMRDYIHRHGCSDCFIAGWDRRVGDQGSVRTGFMEARS